jgi:hypothetical protein
MSPWYADKLVEQRMQDLGRAGAGWCRSATGTSRGPDPTGWVGGRLSVWCGYRMINLGSRLLRPALLAGAGA